MNNINQENLDIEPYKLTEQEIKEIKPVNIDGKEDFLIPVHLASRLKGISRQALNLAVSKGNIRRYDGVLLGDLNKYEVDTIRRKNGLKTKESK